MPERPTPTEQLTRLKSLQSRIDSAYADARKTGQRERVEAILSEAEASAQILEESLDPTRRAEELLGKDAITMREVGDITDDGGDRVFEVTTPLRGGLTREDLEHAKKNGEQLHYEPTHFTNAIVAKHSFGDNSITMERLLKVFPKTKDDNKLLYNTDWYKQEEFFTTDTPRGGHKLTTKEILTDSTSKNYVQQLDVLVKHLEEVVYKGRTMPEKYAKAITTYRGERGAIEHLLATDANAAAAALIKLDLIHVTGESPVELILALLIRERVRGDRQLTNLYVRLPRRTSGGHFVRAGRFDADGVSVDGRDLGIAIGLLGLRLSRS